MNYFLVFVYYYYHYGDFDGHLHEDEVVSIGLHSCAADLVVNYQEMSYVELVLVLEVPHYYVVVVRTVDNVDLSWNTMIDYVLVVVVVVQLLLRMILHYLHLIETEIVYYLQSVEASDSEMIGGFGVDYYVPDYYYLHFFSSPCPFAFVALS